MKLYATMISLALCFLSASSYGDPLKVVFLGESSSQDDVWLYRVECMRKAASEIGADFRVDFAQGDYQRHAQLIKDAVAQGAEAIISPFWDNIPYQEAVTEAMQHGVFLYGMLGMEPMHLLSEDLSASFGYVNVDWNAFGRQLAAIAVDWAQDGDQVLWPTEAMNSSYTLDAIAGFHKYFSDLGMLIHMETIEVGFEAETATSTIKKHLENNKKVAIIATSGAIAIKAANRAVKELKLAPEAIALIGQVVCPDSVQGVREGFMPSGVNLELTDSSYYAILDAFAAVKLGAARPHRSVGLTQVTKSNLEAVVPKAIIDGSARDRY
jgi:ABC-type sugar transport system substrate-binding protein